MHQSAPECTDGVFEELARGEGAGECTYGAPDDGRGKGVVSVRGTLVDVIALLDEGAVGAARIALIELVATLA